MNQLRGVTVIVRPQGDCIWRKVFEKKIRLNAVIKLGSYSSRTDALLRREKVTPGTCVNREKVM